MIGQASASELKVSYGLKSYTLNFSAEKIAFKAHLMELSIEKQNCTEGLLLKFNNQVEAALKRARKISSPNEDLISVNFNQKKFSVSAASLTGKFLVSVPNEIKRQKIEESMSCK